VPTSTPISHRNIFRRCSLRSAVECATRGNSWPTTVLDVSGLEIAFVNAPRLGVGQESARFRWVPCADPLLAPFSGNRPRASYPGGSVTLADLIRGSGKATLPASLDEYLATIVDPALTRWESAGAPAVKFLSAH
jgi:hypothetical protein